MLKKILVTVILFITFILLYFIQTKFFGWFTIAGIKPNLFIIFMLLVGLFINEWYGLAVRNNIWTDVRYIYRWKHRNKCSNNGTYWICRGKIKQELFKRK